ncbi:MAG: anti-sigma factor family protein [Jatrophihabitans sp.]
MSSSDGGDCPMAELDGAYVLGALSPTERSSYEKHLTTCAECRESVQDIAGLPGLLARVAAAMVAEPPPMPDLLWPRLVASAAKEQRRSRLRIGLAGAAVAACVVALVGLGWTIWEHNDTGASRPPVATRQFDALPGINGIAASATVEQVAWGTRVVMHCSEGKGYKVQIPYDLVVITKDGVAHQGPQWKPLPGKTVRLEQDLSIPADQIASMEIRLTDGTPLLRLVI